MAPTPPRRPHSLSRLPSETQQNPRKILGFQTKRHTMLSQPAAGGRQLIGLRLSKNIEFEGNQRALTAVSPSGWRGSTQGALHRTLPSATHTTQAPSFGLWGRRNISSEEGASGKGAGTLFFSQTTDLPPCPASHALLWEAFISWLLLLGTQDRGVDKLP